MKVGGVDQQEHGGVFNRIDQAVYPAMGGAAHPVINDGGRARQREVYAAHLAAIALAHRCRIALREGQAGPRPKRVRQLHGHSGGQRFEAGEQALGPVRSKFCVDPKRLFQRR